MFEDAPEASSDAHHAASSVGPCAIIILGASGDLTKRKLLPAVAGLARDGYLPEHFALVATARSPISNEEYHKTICQSSKEFGEGGEVPQEALDRIGKVTRYVAADLAKPDGQASLLAAVVEAEKEFGTQGNRLFYLSLPPATYADTVRRLVEGGLLKRGGADGAWHRVVVEKPSGTDLKSALQLNEQLRELLQERQIFRIDHYLGKDTVQNLLVMRFANVIFEPLWNRRYVDHVQLTVGERIGIEGRGQFYEAIGTLRDIFQNHLLQLLCLVAMEPPVSFSADSVRDEKVKVLRAVRRWSSEHEVTENTARGQYGPGTADDQPVASYRQESGVDKKSNRETYAMTRFLIDNWRWQDVPFYMRSGKRLARRHSEIFMKFKTVPHMMFKATDRDRIQPNSLTIRIQPDEGISLSFEAKEPGVEVRLRPVDLDFSYQSGFKTKPPSAYQTLLLQALQGDATLFTRRDEIEAQ